MPCFIALIALFIPRVIIALMVLFTDYLGRAYHTILWPLLGFLFMPLTTLAYAYAKNTAGSVEGFYLVLVVVAVFIDLGIIGGARPRKGYNKYWRR